MNTVEESLSEIVSDLLAKAALKQNSWMCVNSNLISDEDIFEEFNLKDCEEIVKKIFVIGFREVVKRVQYYDRVRLKVMQLDPEVYSKLEKHEEGREKRRLQAEVRRDRLAKERKLELAPSLEASRKFLDKLKVAVEFYDNWKLSSGKSLGEATKQDLINEALANKKSADGHMQNYTFYTKMAELVPEGKTVSESVDLGEAHKLRESVYTNS